MDAFRLAATVVVMVGVVVAILLFERRRAERIERDTRQMARDPSSRIEGSVAGTDSSRRGDDMSNQPDEPRADRRTDTTDQDDAPVGVEIGSTDGEGSMFEPEEDPEAHSD